MKIWGLILVVLGGIAFFGAAMMGDNVIGPTFWIALGAFLLYRANQRKRDKENAEKWKSE